jgi:HD-GYP domain-containing protein (c-di-GMP phosphodiesterase class II)
MSTMLKRIHVSQLRLGMHLKEFCGSWMDHPFWRTAFVLTDPKDIAAILASPIKSVWIDCSQGLDVAPEPPDVSGEASLPHAGPHPDHEALPRRETAPVSTAVEIERATRICSQAKQAVVSMFEEARMGNCVNVGGAKQLVDDINDSVTRNPGALISLARLKSVDDYTYMHSVAVCAMMVALARQLGLDEEQTRSAGLAGLLHDMGKVHVPLSILNKPGALTHEEFVRIQEHPADGQRMLLGGANLDPIALDVCLHHHERIDGSGYPDKLKGEAISLFAKMAAVCDVYDAITSNRPYKPGWDPAESLHKMSEWASAHFDREVFLAFVKSLGIYPVGSLVRLTSGRIGVVVEQHTQSLTKPVVKVFFSTKANIRIPAETIDLSGIDVTEKIAAREDPAKWNFPDLHALWSGLAAAPW